jgi:hypothetical protein
VVAGGAHSGNFLVFVGGWFKFKLGYPKTMIFWPFCAFIWFKNIEKMLLQMTSGFLQLESTLCLS